MFPPCLDAVASSIFNHCVCCEHMTDLFGRWSPADSTMISKLPTIMHLYLYTAASQN